MANDFHRTKKSAAVLKHGIIDSYAAPFIGKTGKWSPDNRVAFIDGYAGPGRYEDGEEGSAAILIRHAKKHAHMPRRVELHFVEQDPETVEQLIQVVDAEGAGLTTTVGFGNISTYLPNLLRKSEGIPLFVYLDPCGLVIPFEEVVSVFARPGGQGAPATEVLINFSAVALRRIAGQLTSPNAVEATLVRMDQVCGGDWWRKAWLDHMPDREAAEEAVVNGYAGRLSNAASSGHWVIDVRPKSSLKPLYYLVFASRHADGMEYFGEASSLGLERWRKYTAAQAASGTLLDDEDGSWEKLFKDDEARLKAQWIDAITARLSAELAKGEPFHVLGRYTEVFGELAGVARGLHLRAAMNKVLAAGLTTTSPAGAKKLLTLWLIPTRP